MKDVLIRWLILKLQSAIAWLYSCQSVPVWRSFDGRVTPINEMSTTHLVNTINLLQRRKDEPESPNLPFLQAELARRPQSELNVAILYARRFQR